MKDQTVKRINSPEGVTALMESMWLRHQLGMPQHSDNTFIVDLPPLEGGGRKALSEIPDYDTLFDKYNDNLEYWHYEPKN